MRFPGLKARVREWMFRRQGDGTGPIVLTQRRIFIVPTRAGLLYAVALVVMLIGAINYSLGLGHALVFLLVGLGFVGMVHTFRNLAWLQLSPGRCEPVFAGDLAHFPLRLSHDRPIARLGLAFRAGENPWVQCDLPANRQATIALPVQAATRGWLELPRIRLETTYPLGLFVAWSYPYPSMRCLVYPQPLEMPLPAPGPAAHTGSRHGSSGEEDFAGLRARQTADSPRHVAWKAAARAPERPLLVKQFAGGAQSELWLDWQLLPEQMPAETRLSVLTAWVLQADARNVRYGLRLPGVEIAMADGRAHRDACLEQLALARI